MIFFAITRLCKELKFDGQFMVIIPSVDDHFIGKIDGSVV